MPKTARLLAMVVKERRQRVQDELRQLYHSTIVHITAKSLGSVKYHDDTVSLVYYAKDVLRRHIQKAQCCLFEERVYHFPAGPWAIMAIDGDANVLKDICISIEEEGNCGRLIDIDVFDHQGRQICRFSRGFQERHCIICQQCASECIRTHNHPQPEVIAATKTLMIEYWAKRTNNWPEPVEVIGTTALEAMLMEVACAPAPGLVDRFNSGAHNDMDFFTFIKSSSALAPAMYRCALAGWEHRGEADELLLVLRSIGQEAEGAMFRATNGINTQKGLLFLMGVTAAAAARVLRRQVVRNTFTETVLEETSAICKGIVERELGVLRHRKPLRRLTSGEEFYLSHGIRGIRGEVEDGLPSVKTKGLPFFREAMGTGCSLNDALVHALIGLMSEVEDTTILCRHGIDTLTKVQAEAKSIVENGGMLTITGCQRIESLDARFSQLRISPGGSADLLAVTYFLDCIEERFGVSCQ